MVSKPIQPFIIPVTIQNLCTSLGLEQGALIDSGGTRCLIQRVVVETMGICMVKLKQAINFEQMDGSILGGGSFLPPMLRSLYNWREKGIRKNLDL